MRTKNTTKAKPAAAKTGKRVIAKMTSTRANANPVESSGNFIKIPSALYKTLQAQALEAGFKGKGGWQRYGLNQLKDAITTK